MIHSELLRQHQAHLERRKKLFSNAFRKPIIIIEDPVKEEPKPIIRPLWQIIDVSFDWHVNVWREAIECQIADIAHENIALRAALRVAGLDLELARSPRRPAKEIIKEVLANFPGVSWEDLKGARRTRDIVYPRQLAMYELYVQRKDLSFPAIGRLFGGRDHTTVLHAVNKIKAMTEDDRDAALWMQRRQRTRESAADRKRVQMNLENFAGA